MLYQEQNPGVEFEYSIPSESVVETPSGGEGYQWTPGPWSECPSECGGASKSRSILCTLTSSKEIVADNLCDETQKPPSEEACNEDPCEVMSVIKKLTMSGVFSHYYEVTAFIVLSVFWFRQFISIFVIFN